MAKHPTPEHYYLQFLEFLLEQKRTLIEAGVHNNLTLMQTIMMLLLEEARPMRYLATVTSCDASNVTGIADGLQHKGLVERSESDSDRRIRMLALSPKGSTVRQELIKELAKEADSALLKLTVSERDTLFKLIDKMAGKEA